MCQISNQIKFCTCNKQVALTANSNFWVIYRQRTGAVIGEVVFNENTLQLEDIEVQKLQDKLNETNMFDFEYIPENEDKLIVNLSYKGQNAEYCFKYMNHKWVFYENPLEWTMDAENQGKRYLIEYSGKIENAFKESLN